MHQRGGASFDAENDGKDLDEPSTAVLFDMSKGETSSPNKELRPLYRALKKEFQVRINKDEISRETLRGVRCVILGAPTKRFEQREVKALKAFVSDGGAVLALAQEGGEERYNDTLNSLTSAFGITINNDSVVRTAYRKDYFHPKEVYISGASLTAEIDQLAGKQPKTSSLEEEMGESLDQQGGDTARASGSLNVVYPYGATLSIERPAVPLITSGQMAFPANRALLAGAKLNKGIMLCMGSALPFSQRYVRREDNEKLMRACVRMLTQGETKVGSVEHDRPEYKNPVQVPDMEALAERLRCCLQEPEDLPADFAKMFDHKLFGYDTDMIPEVLKLYKRLNVKHEALSLIPPQFEVPLPPLQPAVFLPCMRELAPPALDLFDLDQEFSDSKAQLAMSANQCKTKDLDFFVMKAGAILNINSELAKEGQDVNPKTILHKALSKLVKFKSIN